MENLNGKRIRVTRGTPKMIVQGRIIESEGFEPHAIWAAGNVPVGSVGTIKEKTPHMYEITWDDPAIPQPTPEYFYGLGKSSPLASGLEIMNEKPGVTVTCRSGHKWSTELAVGATEADALALFGPGSRVNVGNVEDRYETIKTVEYHAAKK